MTPTRRFVSSGTIGLVLLHILFGMLFLMGMSALMTGALLLWLGEDNRIGAGAAVGLGLALIMASVVFFRFVYITGPRARAHRKRAQALHPNRPWMERQDWAARKVVYSDASAAVFSWIWVIGWCSGIGLIVALNIDRIRLALSESWVDGLLALAFAGATLIALRIAIRATLAWWRFGRSTLRIDTLPGYIGDRFRGRLQTRLRPASRENLKIDLVCEGVRWVETGSSSKKKYKLEARTLSETSTSFDARRLFTGRGGVSVPIEIAIPSGLPESFIDERGNGVRWRLSVSATSKHNAPFRCSFEIPVYDRRRSASDRRQGHPPTS
jgi:hypothetical protein